MFIFKVLGAITKFGGKIVDVYEDVLDYVDHLIHKKEYERRARKRRIFWTRWKQASTVRSPRFSLRSAFRTSA